MSVSSFNLIDEPWLVVKDLKGAVRHISIKEAFRDAQNIHGLAGELPSQNFAVLRILLAILYRVFDKEEHENAVADWRDLWEQTSLPISPIEKYLEKWHHRFFLFDREYPWFQVGNLESVKGDKKPVNLLIPDCPSDDNLFTMRRNYKSISPAEAARWLIHCQAYDISGIKTGAVGDVRVKERKGYPIGPGWAGRMGGIAVTGDNLRETLLLNLVFSRKHSEYDLPIWEQPAMTAAERKDVQVHGQIELLTWPQRRIRLFLNTDGEVGEVLICNGDPIAYQFQDSHELMTGWRYSVPQSKKFKKSIYMPREFDSEEVLWKGISALLPTIGTEAAEASFKPCGVLEWSANLAQEGILPFSNVVRIETVGVVYGSSITSWEEIFSDELSFNVRLAAASGLAAKETIYAAAERATEAARAVGRLAGDLSIAAGGDAEAQNARGRIQAFSALDRLFRVWLKDFNPEDDLELQLQRWTDTAREIIKKIGQQLVEEAGPAAWIGRRSTQSGVQRFYSTGVAEVRFRHSLFKAFPCSESEKENK